MSFLLSHRHHHKAERLEMIPVRVFREAAKGYVTDHVTKGSFVGVHGKLRTATRWIPDPEDPSRRRTPVVTCYIDAWSVAPILIQGHSPGVDLPARFEGAITIEDDRALRDNLAQDPKWDESW